MSLAIPPYQASKQAAEAAADKANSELGDMRDFLGGVAETFARRYSTLFCAAALCLEDKLANRQQ